jgi:hypothetical protein
VDNRIPVGQDIEISEIEIFPVKHAEIVSIYWFFRKMLPGKRGIRNSAYDSTPAAGAYVSGALFLHVHVFP